MRWSEKKREPKDDSAGGVRSSSATHRKRNESRPPVGSKRGMEERIDRRDFKNGRGEVVEWRRLARNKRDRGVVVVVVRPVSGENKRK